MNIGILGTGSVGRTLSSALAAHGHGVVIGTRDVGARAAGDDAFVAWQEVHRTITVAPFADAAASGDIVFNATSGTASLSALEQAGADNLAGKILIDVANPLDFSNGMPPTLTVCNDDSLGEQIQRALPDTRVVKALNTVTADVMVAPALVAGGDHDLLICGDDAGAKATVESALKEWFGWRSAIDLGDISASRGMEMYLPLWLRLMSAHGTPMFNVKVMR